MASSTKPCHVLIHSIQKCSFPNGNPLIRLALEITKTTEKLHNHDFLSRVMAGAAQHWTKAQTELLKVNYIHLSNQISAAASIDQGDLHGVNRTRTSTFSHWIFLEILSSGDLSLACKILTSEYPKTLFRHAMTVVHHYRLDIIDTLKKLGIDDFVSLRKTTPHQNSVFA